MEHKLCILDHPDSGTLMFLLFAQARSSGIIRYTHLHHNFAAQRSSCGANLILPIVVDAAIHKRVSDISLQ